MFGRTRSTSTETLRTGLGLASLGLGLTQLMNPGGVNQFLGIPDYNPNHSIQRLLGARELVSGTGILFGGNKRAWMWSRVAGDAMDLSILGSMLITGLGVPKRLAPAMVAVGALMILDAGVALRTDDS